MHAEPGKSFMPETTMRDDMEASPKQSAQQRIQNRKEMAFKNFNWTQMAFLAMRSIERKQPISSIGNEELNPKSIEEMKEWRDTHPDAKSAAKAYPLPEGLLAGVAGEHRSIVSSEDLARSASAYTERTGIQESDAGIDGFREALRPLVARAKSEKREFNPKLLDLVGAQGGEHSVIFTPGRVLKVTEPDTAGVVVKINRNGEPNMFHGTATAYVRQLEQNRDLLGDTTHIEGVMKHKGGALSIV